MSILEKRDQNPLRHHYELSQNIIIHKNVYLRFLKN